MTLVQAIQSGKKFKRKEWSSYLYAKDGAVIHWATADDTRTILLTSDIVADDWEVEDTSVEITTKQFWDAVDAVLQITNDTYRFANELATRLGLDNMREQE